MPGYLLIFFDNRLVILPEGQTASYVSRITSDPSFKGCISKSLTYATYLNNNMKNGTRLNILNENHMTIQNVIYTRKNFYLLGALNEKIEEIKSSGLLGYWHYKRKADLEPINVKKPPKVLTFERLVGCFEIWAFGLFVSFLSFLIEAVLFCKFSRTPFSLNHASIVSTRTVSKQIFKTKSKSIK